MTTKLIEGNKVSNLGPKFVELLDEMMRENKDIYYLDCDLTGALGSSKLMEGMAKQSINCGIMEANMMGIAAGMSIGGKIPFAHTFGPFASRRVADQVFVSGCYNKANVKIVGSDPGVTAEHNGGTHMPFEDVAIYRAYPEMTILDISDEALLEGLLPEITSTYGMMYIRFPRKNSECYYDKGNSFEIGKAKLLLEGEDVTIIASGVEVQQALIAADMLKKQNIHARVVDMFTIKPIDVEMILDSAEKTGAIVTAENHNVIGGLGSAVAEVLSENKPCIMKRIGVVEQFGQVGGKEYLSEVYKLNADAIVDACKELILKK